MTSKSLLPILLALVAGCSGSSVTPSIALGRVGPDAEYAARPHRVYWTLYASPQHPQVQIAAVPLKAKSRVTNVSGNARNKLNYTSGLTTDAQGRLWVLAFGSAYGNPGTVLVFKVPLKPNATPLYSFVLSQSSGPDALAFDRSGNLWVVSPGNWSVLEYAGPFKKSGTLSPAMTLSAPGYTPSGIGFDKSGNAYVSNYSSTGSNSIAVLAPPYNGPPHWLNGLTAPGGLAFDEHGNLYASTDGPAPAVVRYDSGHLRNGDTPTIVDPTGLASGSYIAAFAFTGTGDLYAANCGSGGSAGIDVYPTGTKSFSSKLAPSLTFTDAGIEAANCAWGIAIE